MIYKAVFCGFMMLATMTAFCQGDVARAFHHLYHVQKHLFHRNAYICDSSISSMLLSPVLLKENLGVADTSAAIDIWKKGNPYLLKSIEIASYLPQKPSVISLKRFNTVQTAEPELSACEVTALGRLDSLNSLKTGVLHETNNDRVQQEISLQQEQLYHSSCFISYLRKISERRAIFIFFPVIKLKNHYLMVWQYYYSPEDNFITGKVISLN